MAKLYPPYIEGTIPAFTGAILVVPFSMNKAVGSSQIKGLSLKVKKINSNDIILTKETDKYENSKAQFDLILGEQELFNIGQYYRIQLAYIDTYGTIGYYSTIGVIKYTSAPTIYIANLDRTDTNIHSYDYTAVYEQTGDSTEKLYSSQLYLYDSDRNIIYDSGEILHSVLNDVVPNEAVELFNIPQDLESSGTYRLQYIATTNNGLTISSPIYKIIQQKDTDMKFDEVKDLIFVAENNYDKGTIDLKIRGIKGEDKVLSGLFLISRSIAKTPYEWQKINRFSMRSQSLADKKIIDYTINQGEKYIYSFQQYNNKGVYSTRLISNVVTADFEDLFLLDGEKQLKIKFNPKVSSIKNTILENKINTIGSKYPFITRNGNVNYKEFNISGLVSYQMDDTRDFYTWKELELESNVTDLISENIKAERKFKLDVLDWLNNGEPKLFKSPVEGNYLVRLMNVSMTPIDTVGRMLHTFTAVASEIAPFDYNNLNNFGFLNLDTLMDTTVSKWMTIELATKDDEGKYVFKQGRLTNMPLYYVKITGATPGSIFTIGNQDIYIGTTGSYSVRLEEPIYTLAVPKDAQYFGTIDVEYKGELKTSFDRVNIIKTEEIPIQQFFEGYYIEEKINENGEIEKTPDLIKSLNNIKNSITKIPIARFFKREAHKIYINRTNLNGKGLDSETLKEVIYYKSGLGNGANVIDLDLLDDTYNIYKIYFCEENYLQFREGIDDDNLYYQDTETGEKFLAYTEFYYDPIRKTIAEDSYDMYEIRVNTTTGKPIDDRYINIKELEDYEMRGLDYYYIRFNSGVYCELTYFLQITDYAYEEEEPNIFNLKQIYENELSIYLRHREDSSISVANKRPVSKVINAYNNFIAALTERINEDAKLGIT